MEGVRLYNWSDLHLDRDDLDFNVLIDQLELSDSNINILILAGDISKPLHSTFTDFFSRISEYFDDVIYVPGNHEYHSDTLTFEEVEAKIRELLTGSINIHFLNNESIELYDFVFIGSTLWSYIPLQYQKYLNSVISDYKGINWKKNIKFSPLETNQLNNKALLFLEDALDHNKDKKCIVITHHAPIFPIPDENSYISDPKHHNDIKNYAYHNNLPFLLNKPVFIWIFGHTHYRNVLKVNDSILWTNAHGYINEIAEPYNVNNYIQLK